MKKTYTGGCHCGKVRFEADIDLSAGTGKCNCSICAKRRNWSAMVKPEAFRLLSGDDALTDYQWGTKSGHHRFCSTCGVASFGEGYVEEIGGAYVAVAVMSLVMSRVNSSFPSEASGEVIVPMANAPAVSVTSASLAASPKKLCS